MSINKKELQRLGVPKGAMQLAADAAKSAIRAGYKKAVISSTLAHLVADPKSFLRDERFGSLASELLQPQPAHHAPFAGRETPAPYKRWGEDIDPESIRQMEDACALPISKVGALMPDAHVGYGLPIGGVLATRNAVIPYAVGVDIACRMKLTALDLPIATLEQRPDMLKSALIRETRFGIGASFHDPRDHKVMDEDWRIVPLAARLKDKAHSQLGTSGSGNHFAEFGILTIEREDLGIAPGKYLALLSHSGSRGTGAEIASHYSRLARTIHPDLPKELSHLAWLDLDTEEGAEYWHAMELMGRYASANHQLIHRHVARALGAQVLLDIENHHNFAWREEHDGESLIVHRKGATPAGLGVLGIIPGSMASPAYIVRGKGNPASLNSAAHGAGRRMSRKQAMRQFSWPELKRLLAERGVTLMSAGLDESPMAYKNIDEVMAAQTDLVEPVARFDPRLVRMAEAGERPED
jgi:tRNA-splicing ligase RtcB (3'-phosphate/5'-hydroxy nucleic acid ligase)